jgi:uroporphyrinogen-III decarboxylase
MKEKWIEVAEDAAQKQEKRFEIWSAGADIPFENPEAKKKYQEKVGLIKDAVQLNRNPKRVPVCPSPGHYPLEYAGIRFYDAMYDTGAITRAWTKFYTDFHPDTFSRSFIGSGKLLDLLDSKTYHWPGHGVAEDKEYQFAEAEFMKAEEYDELINDPTWFHLSTYLPRVSGALKALKKIPTIVHMRHMSSMAGAALPFSTPEVQEALKTLAEAGAVASDWVAENDKLARSLMGRGYPALAGGLAEAPFDIIGDCFRGTRGVVMDIFRHPDKLSEACEKYVLPTIKRGVAMADASGNPLIFMPLHKGADPFMSGAHFKQFYWKTLRKVLIGLMNEGLVPLIFAESVYDSRLEIIADLPPKTVIWWFEKVDMSRAKKILGNTACIMGNVPNILFRSGSPEDMEACCKELIDVAGKDGGYILSTAAGMQGANPENVRTLIEFGKSYGVYR